MSMLDDLLANLLKSNVPIDDGILKRANEIAEELGLSNEGVQEALAKVMRVASDKKGNKDTQNVQEPLEGFNAAYDLAVSGDNGWRDVEPKEAFKKIEDVKNRATALDKPATTYDHQAVASDLIRATRGLNIDTPELSLKTLKMQKELFDGLEGSGHYCTSPEYRLDTFNKSTRYLGDEKVAKAYLEATLPVMEKLDDVSSATDLLKQNMLKTKQRFAEIATLHPHLAEAAQKFPLTAEDKVALAEKKAQNDAELKVQNDAIKTPHQENNHQKSDTKQSVKDKAKSFIEGSTVYAAGAKMFNTVREGVAKRWNEVKATIKEQFRKNPELFAIAGAGLLFAGFNLPIANFAKRCTLIGLTNKVMGKFRSQEKANNAVSVAPSQQASGMRGVFGLKNSGNAR